ncbi:MAG: polyhydroxybutyrate depolymerase [Roseovarius sp.]|nr:polyhydroxybutyrate depolymerase [Roseovarius sp.]
MRFAALCLAIVLAAPAHGCGEKSDCALGDRHYRIALPEGAERPAGAVVYAHGYRGSAAGVMRNAALRRALSDRGLALIALKSLADDWVIPHAPGHADATGVEEIAYVAAVLDDVAARFGIGEGLMAAGYSSGAMMVWTLACALPDRFVGFAAVAGTFWQRPPDTCATPHASIVHVHGTNDPTVPLEGRAIRETSQGDVGAVMEFYTRFGGFRDAGAAVTGDLDCTQRRNAAGAILDLCLHPGGHAFRVEYILFAWERFRAAGRF